MQIAFPEINSFNSFKSLNLRIFEERHSDPGDKRLSALGQNNACGLFGKCFTSKSLKIACRVEADSNGFNKR